MVGFRFDSSLSSQGLLETRRPNVEKPQFLAGAASTLVFSKRISRKGVTITLDTYSHAIPAMQGEAALIARLVFAGR